VRVAGRAYKPAKNQTINLEARDCGYALGSKRLNKCSNFKITR